MGWYFSKTWPEVKDDSIQLVIHATPNPPEFSSAAVNGAALTVSFDEELDPNSVPAPGDFHVTVGGSRRNVAPGGVAISDGVVTLALDSAAVAADTVQVRYTQPATNPLQDAAGNPVDTFTDQAVINTTGSVVSNVGQTEASRLQQADFAQAFTTGSHAGGYTLTRVDVVMRKDGSSAAGALGIHADAAGVPGASVSALSVRGTLTATKGVIQLVASGEGINLDANTSYWLVLDYDGPHGVTHFHTSSDTEDAGAAQDWSIAETSRNRLTLSGTWEAPFAESLQIAVHATPKPTTVAVGNYGQPDDGDATLDKDHAQAFTTGEVGYRLTRWTWKCCCRRARNRPTP